MPKSRRDHLVDTAADLFDRDGYHATGIDAILSAAGVAKMTLYKHFRSKDELTVAALRIRSERFRGWLRQAVERRAEEPRARLLALFDALEEWFRRPGFRGCMFTRAAAEFGPVDNPVHAAAAEHKRQLLDDVVALAEAAEVEDAASVARALVLLIEGAIGMAQISGDVTVARDARRAAAVLVDAARA